MPWVNVTLSQPCPAEKQLEIKAGLVPVMEMMGKREAGLTVTFVAAAGYYRAGQPTHDAAMVDMRYIGEFDLGMKREITRRIAQLLAGALGLDPLRVSVVMTEYKSDNWGRNAGDYS